jgi:hypothetical protein
LANFNLCLNLKKKFQNFHAVSKSPSTKCDI